MFQTSQRKKNSLNNQEIYINVNHDVAFFPRSHMEVCYEEAELPDRELQQTLPNVFACQG
jgi:hypothetical protein